MNSTADLIIKNINGYCESLKDEYSLEHSWEHCFKQFADARKNRENADVDYLSLHLAFYLASWGMFRGSCFIREKDYKVHSPVVEELLKEKYDVLFDLKCEDLLKENRNICDVLFGLKDWLTKFYIKVRESTSKKNEANYISQTLITKILMGTLGCVPAYDTYFVSGVKSTNVATGSFNETSIMQLAKFYVENKEKFEPIRKTIIAYDFIYPQMKFIDMGFNSIGYKLENKKLVGH